MTANKLRRLELLAGMPSGAGRRARPPAYSLKAVRRRENAPGRPRHAYRQLVTDWQAKAPSEGAGVAADNGARLSRPSGRAKLCGRLSPEPALRSGVDPPTPQPNADRPPTDGRAHLTFSVRECPGRAVASDATGRSSDRRRADRLTFCRPLV